MGLTKYNDIRILIADDDEDDLWFFRALIFEWKDWDYYTRRNDKVTVTVDSARTREDIIRKLAESHYDLFFLDYRLGGWNGLDILKEIREKEYTFPVIILTGRGDQEVAVQAMKLGAADYLVKSSLTPESLFKVIRHTINLFREEQKRIRAEESLRDQGLLLQGVSEAAIRLLTVYDHESAIQEALQIAGKAGSMDRIYIFQDHPDPKSGEDVFSLKYFWRSEGERISNEGLRDLTYTNLGSDELIRELRMGKSISHVMDSSNSASQFFQIQGLQSCVLASLIIDHTYWGFALFANVHSSRVWSPDDESILKTFSASIGSEIKRNRDDQAFRSIVKGASAQTGDKFFKSLVRNLASALPARCAMVSEVFEGQDSKYRIIAGWNGEMTKKFFWKQFVSDLQYEVPHALYENLLRGSVIFYSDGVQEAFPDEIFLREIGAKSYAGVPFFDSSLNVMGHLVVFDRRPMLDKERTLSILRLFAARAGAELERKRAEETIKNMAYYDPLTGLPNRLLLIDRLTLALAHAHRVKKRLAVMFLDFDNFKLVNDNYGHGMGDLFLREMGEKLKSNIRKEDTLARLGGDEFILVLPELEDRESAVTLAEKLVTLGREPLNLDGNEIKSSFSIGISLYPDNGTDYETLLKKADDALYEAKRNGRDRYQFVG